MLKNIKNSLHFPDAQILIPEHRFSETNHYKLSDYLVGGVVRFLATMPTTVNIS